MALTTLVFVVLACTYLFYARAGEPTESGGPMSAEGRARARAERDAAEGKPIVALERASNLGFEGWQTAEQEDPTKDHADLKLPGIDGAAESLAATRAGLHFIEADERGRGLSGLIEPRDVEAIAVSLLLQPVRVRGLADVPPTAQLRSLADAAAAAVALVSIDPSSSALVGGRASQYPEQCRALEAAGSTWPASARVWRVMAAPPGDSNSLSRLSVNCRPGDEPRGLIERLRAAGVRTFESVNGRWATADASIVYQNSEGGDRFLHVKFLYDKATEQWVLAEIGSLPSKAEAMRWVQAGNTAELSRNTHTIDVPAVLKDHLVTSHGLITAPSTK